MTLDASGLSRTFRGHTAVHAADLTLPAGRICGLVGPNGAGKTTFLLMLAGLLASDTGTIKFNGEVVSPQNLRRQVGWMPDTFGTWESLTSREILTTFGRLYGQSAKSARSRADDLLAQVHLNEYADRKAHELSRGQKQRLGFARTLMNNPAILLLDEPASGMDPRSRVELRDHLRRLADDGTAILLSSHILAELSEMVDDVVLMTAGRTQTYAAPTEPRWRIRRIDQSVDEAEVVDFPDERTAASYLSQLVGSGAQIAEFTRISDHLEDAYLALDPVRR
ncbi:putative ABC transporter ATP-binding protein [Gordonia effusa NBRC 100432]|uniref:Putative ABC transporter ATP-binding protein n=1 Tax=Gordonia effusa NBRC 100432 TaxID=1077974 RepID=H0QUS9_9ACTN|nr:ABC transporter ATP-binding protein [Gordonia effusa]GAB16580.1 putative ABC transporter ATP-binding protein [Gordonia effusa NBRC 100432]